MSGFRIFGIALALVGVAAAVFPALFGPLTGGHEPPGDVFQAIERRVRGGMVLGVGLGFIAVTALRPWSTTIPTAIFYLMTGALAARLFGLLVDGTVPKQWLLVAVEAVVMALAAFGCGTRKRLATATDPAAVQRAARNQNDAQEDDHTDQARAGDDKTTSGERFTLVPRRRRLGHIGW